MTHAHTHMYIYNIMIHIYNYVGTLQKDIGYPTNPKQQFAWTAGRQQLLCVKTHWCLPPLRGLTWGSRTSRWKWVEMVGNGSSLSLWNESVQYREYFKKPVPNQKWTSDAKLAINDIYRTNKGGWLGVVSRFLTMVRFTSYPFHAISISRSIPTAHTKTKTQPSPYHISTCKRVTTAKLCSFSVLTVAWARNDMTRIPEESRATEWPGPFCFKKIQTVWEGIQLHWPITLSIF